MTKSKKMEKTASKKSQKHGNILGIHVDSTDRIRVLRFIRASVTKKHKFFITTPNPEMVVRAQKDRTFGKILNSSDISVPDGIGLSAANKFLSLKLPDNLPLKLIILPFWGGVVGLAVLLKKDWLEKNLKIIKGRELFLDIIKLANKLKWKVYFFGGEKGEAAKAAEVLRRSYKGVKIKTSDGPILGNNGQLIYAKDRKAQNDMVRDINVYKPHILFVGMTPPKQEKWLNIWMPRLNIGGAMVVGGTFLSISGKRKSVPDWISRTGLEWFWRLATGSQKLGRIFNAVVIFPYLVFWKKLKQGK